MIETPIASLSRHMDTIKDPRRHNIRHLLHDMLLIALCAIISGADSWTQVSEYGRSKQQWFSQFLTLPNGIPSHDTFGRVFAMLDPKGFESFFSRWVHDFAQSIKGKTVCIDGKTLRGSHDNANGKSAIHMVSAWAADLGMVLGQLKTDAKSNEITAIPELIKTLALQGAVVTIDAMGCQKNIARTIIEAKADYVIQVKDNQKRLHEDIALFFQESTDNNWGCVETIDGEHGRIETRHYKTTDDIDWLEWPGLKTIAMATRERDTNGTISRQNAYFICSMENDTVAIAKAIREHWGIENSLHWCLDISFREDDCRVRKDHAPENLGILRHMAINLLKKENSLKAGIQTKRLKAAWDHSYLLKILAA
jgi:predicted transposase YbfD/YdcC